MMSNSVQRNCNGSKVIVSIFLIKPSDIFPFARPSVICGRKMRSSVLNPAKAQYSSTTAKHAARRGFPSREEPIQMIFGERKSGKHPIDVRRISNGVSNSPARKSSDRVFSTCGRVRLSRNFNVTWNFVWDSQRTPDESGFSKS